MSPAPAPSPGPRRRGPARGFSRGQVVEAALDELRDNGIGGVSFRSVSRRLGVNPMALYTYVKDKDELITAMFDRIFGKVGEALPDEIDDPRAALIAYFTAVYRQMVEYADLSRLVRPSAAGMDLDLVERVYRLVGDLGVARERIADVHLALLELTVGSALTASAGDRPIAAEANRPFLSAVLRRVDELNWENHFVHTLGLLLDTLRGTYQ